MAEHINSKQPKHPFGAQDEIESGRKTALAKVDRQKKILFGELREIRTCTPYLKDSVSEFNFPEKFSLRSTSVSTGRRLKNLYGNREKNYRQLKANLTSRTSCLSTKEVSQRKARPSTSNTDSSEACCEDDTSEAPANGKNLINRLAVEQGPSLHSNMAHEIGFLTSGTRRRLRMARNISMSLEALYNQKRELIRQEYAYGADVKKEAKTEAKDETTPKNTRSNTGMTSGFKWSV